MGSAQKNKKTWKKRKTAPGKNNLVLQVCAHTKSGVPGKPTAVRTPKQYEISLFSNISTAFSPRFRLKKPKNDMKSGAPGKPTTWRLSNTIDFLVGGNTFLETNLTLDIKGFFV